MSEPISEDDRIAESVRRHGWHAIAVEGTEREPPFVYTIGLCDTLGHPDLIIVGLSPRTGHSLLGDAIRAIRAGRVFQPGEKARDLLADYTVELVPVHRTQVVVRMGYALAYYRRAGKPEAMQALQLLWPDPSGLLPTEPGCEEDVVRWQPLLDRAIPPDELRAFMAKYGSPSN